LRGEFANVRSYRSREDQIGRNFERAENYLSLVGLVVVILGGIAVSSVTRVFILQKIKSIAVLKCVGARSREVITIYILQVVALGLAGSLLGIALAAGIVTVVPLVLDTSSTVGPSALLANVEYGLTWSAALQGSASGCSCRCCFPSCRCFTSGSSSRRSCFGTSRRRSAATRSVWPPSRRWLRRSLH
jgi:cell division protein FtsX